MPIAWESYFPFPFDDSEKAPTNRLVCRGFVLYLLCRREGESCASDAHEFSDPLGLVGFLATSKPDGIAGSCSQPIDPKMAKLLLAEGDGKKIFGAKADAHPVGA